MQIRLLGPVDVIVNGGPAPVHGLRRKAVLAVLALRGNEVVSTSQLMDVVWDNAAPSTAANALQAHVSRLRVVLGSKAAIRTRPPGYLLDLDRCGTDVQVADDLLRQGAQPGDPVDGIRHLRAALALWRGRPLEDLAGFAWLEDQARQLDQLRLRVERALVQARMAAGEHAQLLADLAQLSAEHPLDEQVHAQLMLALYRSGRQADALATYRHVRQVLDEELGIDPSQMLRELETAILRQDRALDLPAQSAVLAATARAVAPATPPVAMPAQLPSAVPAFAGRDAELASLDAILPEPAQANSTGFAAVATVVVSGTAGVGKTALAVQWGHRVAERFGDGQLYVNLRGFDPSGQALDPGEAVRGFLEAFGVPVPRIPQGLPAQAALYRSLLAGKRVLVVLDNARDVEQVRPLLPGSPGCMALVTSRNSLTGLVAGEGAYPMTLELLTPAGARDLLVGRLGLDRVAREPNAVSAIIAGCARLPLALSVAAARAVISPSFPLAVFAAELRAATRALDHFHDGDLCTDVRAVFSWSYRALSVDAARLFRLLGLHCGPDIAVAAAASLAAVSPDRARALLAELTRAHLLAEHSPGRYDSHDLLRAYATELASSCDSDDARAAAVRRVLDHYLHTSYRATMAIQPCPDPISIEPARPETVIAEFTAADDALRWFTAESATLLAAVQLAAQAGLDTCTWQLAWTMSSYLLRRGRWADQAIAWNAGLDAARRAGDQAGEAHARYGLADGYSQSGRPGDAEVLFRKALRQFEAIGGQFSSVAAVHNGLACLAERQHHPADALSHALRAYESYRAAGYRPGQARVLNNIGFSHAQLGDYPRAIAYCELALAGLRQEEDRCSESATWDSFGYIHGRLGNYQQAVTCYLRSISLSREISASLCEALALDHLGDVHRNAGDGDAARWAWTRAERVFDEIDHPAGEQVRAKLRSSSHEAA